MESLTFLDANVFFHYADKTSDCHVQARKLIDSGAKIHAAKYVEKEINKIMHERRKLCKDIQKHLYTNPDLKTFTPPIDLKPREETLLEDLKRSNPKTLTDRITFLALHEEALMREALAKTTLTPPQANYWLEEKLKEEIKNHSDATILSDSVTWSYALNRKTCAFHTRDKKDLLDNKTKIEAKAAEYYDEEKILEIRDLKKH